MGMGNYTHYPDETRISIEISPEDMYKLFDEFRDLEFNIQCRIVKRTKQIKSENKEITASMMPVSEKFYIEFYEIDSEE